MTILFREKHSSAEPTHPLAPGLPVATDGLLREARAIRDRRYGNRISYSRKVFIPLTQLCRDVCHYCTFAKAPRGVPSPFMAIGQVLDVARAGTRAGCREALFTLGEKPELRYRAAADWLAQRGYATTIDYVAAAASAVLAETGLLPHINAGNLTDEDIVRLRPVAASMGIMLESASERLMQRGLPHHGSPDKHPRERLATLERFGRHAVPTTTGILIGIGETEAERIEALELLADLHRRYGHIQEVIVQNFRAKPGTRMAGHAEPDIGEIARATALARMILPEDVNLQVPPNLNPESIAAILDAGINDWGGISPVTVDHVNPEAPWPHIGQLSGQMAALGFSLVERMTVHPGHALDPERWIDPGLRPAVLRASDAEGLAREDEWRAGSVTTPPAALVARRAERAETPSASRPVAGILERALSGRAPDVGEIEQLFRARGDDFIAVCRVADTLRRQAVGDTVSYVVTRNINYTNVCTYRCSFCAFSKGRTSEHLRGKPYVVGLDEVARRTREAWNRGATEVCMQGGIHPDYTGETYLSLLRAAKEACPDIHVHAFSPLEVWQGARTLGLSLGAYLRLLKEAGLGSLPGTAAEILDDEVRAVLCPDKLNTAQWLEVVETAHEVGLPTTATIMFGHVEKPVHWARHLEHVRAVQSRTGGFTEFVPLPFVAEEAPLYLKGQARPGPTFREAVLMHSVARIALYGSVSNIQASWVKLGPQGLAVCLQAGVNDLGGTLMNESITRAAGARHGQEATPQTIEGWIEAAGRTARLRTTLYADAGADRRAAALSAGEILPVVQQGYTRGARQA